MINWIKRFVRYILSFVGVVVYISATAGEKASRLGRWLYEDMSRWIFGASIAFMLIVAFISSLPVSWSLAFIYFLTAFGFTFVVCILNYILDNFLKAYFPEIHKRSPEFKSRFKKRRRFK